MVNIKIEQMKIPHDGLWEQVEKKANGVVFRQYQQEVIYTILKAFRSGYDNVVLEAPTGAGKSIMAHTVTQFFQQSFILTSQKCLQAQYIKDFEDTRSLQGQRNYPCHYNRHPTREDCTTGLCGTECPYKKAESDFNRSRVGVTNYHIALMKKKFDERGLLVCDEAHNIEQILMGIVSVDMADKYLAGLGLPQSKEVDTVAEAAAFLKRLNVEVDRLLEKNREAVAAVAAGPGNLGTLRNTKRLEALRERINTFFSTVQKCDWIYCAKEKILKPLYINYFALRLFKLGDKKLFMSATILHKGLFCSNIGLKSDKTVFIRMPSSFPIINRPIYAVFAKYNLNKDNIDNSLPEIIKVTKFLLNKHKHQKGIIHTNSYKISNFLEYKLKNKRLLFVDNKNKNMLLEQHFSSPESTVLVSPGLKEGIDLKDDYSRWQIIVKLPYPFLGDQQIKKRMEKQRLWYDWMTCIGLIQSYGRSVRSSADHADTYILDGTFKRFCSRHEGMLPAWFLAAIKDGQS